MQSKSNGGPSGVNSRNDAAQTRSNGHADGSNPENGDFNDHERTIDDLGKMKISKNESTYVGSSHWVAILKDVSPSRFTSI